MDDIFVDHNSDFLFARPSLLEGMARILDVGGTLTIYNESPSGLIADERAIKADWKAVGNEITASIISHESSHKK